MPDPREYGGTDSAVFTDVSQKMAQVLAPGRILKVSDAIEIAKHCSGDEGWTRDWMGQLYDLEAQHREMDPVQREAFKGSASQEWAILCKGTYVPKMQIDGLFAFFNPDIRAKNWNEYQPGFLYRYLTQPGEFALFTGGYGSGKTDHALLAAQVLFRMKEEQIAHGEDSLLYQIEKEVHGTPKKTPEGKHIPISERKKKKESPIPTSLYSAKGIRFVTNISIEDLPEEWRESPLRKAFKQASRLSDIIATTLENALGGFMTVIILDEMGFAFNKKRTTSRHNFAIERVLRFIRKFFAALMVITQDEEGDVPEALTKACRTKVAKKSPTKAVYGVQGSFIAQTIREVPRTVVKFRTRAFATVTTDLDPGMLVDQVMAVEEKALAIKLPWGDEEMYREAIRFCRESRISDAELAKGQSGIHRAQARFFLQLINEATGTNWTVTEVVEETGADEDLVREVQEQLVKEAKERRSAKTISEPTEP
jgi:hypothetical protein